MGEVWAEARTSGVEVKRIGGGRRQGACGAGRLGLLLTPAPGIPVLWCLLSQELARVFIVSFKAPLSFTVTFLGRWAPLGKDLKRDQKMVWESEF